MVVEDFSPPTPDGGAKVKYEFYIENPDKQEENKKIILYKDDFFVYRRTISNSPIGGWGALQFKRSQFSKLFYSCCYFSLG